jgi:nucleotidyltransferase/DNA polymerase involved in DNA repair
MSKIAVSIGHLGQGVVVDDNKAITIGINDLCYEDIRLLCGTAITAEVRLMIQNKLGFSSSGGIAHNKMLAKIAGSMHKPAKQTVVPRSIVPTLMDTLPISRVPGTISITLIYI